MNVEIKIVDVKSFGLLNNFKLDNLKKINLIYSKNEKGKSTLVEFIIRCLFGKSDEWGNIRFNNETPKGKVVLNIDNKDVEFLPTKEKNSKKLENYYNNNFKLTPYLSKLLIIKSGESEIVNNQVGLDKNFIKNIYFSNNIFDEIDDDKKISKTLKEASLIINENSIEIDIKKQGEGKNYFELKERIHNEENLIKDFINNYESGELKKLNLELENLRQKKTLLENAKRYKAYITYNNLNKLMKEDEKINDEYLKKLEVLINDYNNINNEINFIKNEINGLTEKLKILPEYEERIELLKKAKGYQIFILRSEKEELEKLLEKVSETDINELLRKIETYKYKKLELEKLLNDINSYSEKSKDYIWLKEANNIFNKYRSISFNPSIIIYFLIIIVLFGLSNVLFFLDKKIIGLILGGTCFLLLIIYFLFFKKILNNFYRIKEIENLEKEFSIKFNKELSEVTLVEELKKQEENFNHLSYLNKDYEIKENEINKEREEINTLFLKLLKNINIHRESINELEWKDYLNKIESYRKEKFTELNNIKESLLLLGNIEQIYINNQNPNINFDKIEFEDLFKKINSLEVIKKNLENYNKELNLKSIKLENIKKEIKDIFSQCFDLIDLNENLWNNKLNELKAKKIQISNDITKLRTQFEELGVSINNFLEENPGIEFSQRELDEIIKKIEELNKEIATKKDELTKLKSKLTLIVQKEINIEMDALFKELNTYLRLNYENLEKIKSKILAGIIVHETIEELRKEEDKRINEFINSQEVKDFLKILTYKYEKLSFDDENKIYVNDYLLSDLSTGAREQVFFALRAAFAKKILGNDVAFFLLDDAFQHSDWDRRKILIKTLFELAKLQWQIIYLTMDDNIRDLFKYYSENYYDRDFFNYVEL